MTHQKRAVVTAFSYMFRRAIVPPRRGLSLVQASFNYRVQIFINGIPETRETSSTAGLIFKFTNEGQFGTNRKRRSSWEAASEFRDPPVKVDRLNDDDDDTHLCNVLFWSRTASTTCSLFDEISLISFALNR